MLGLYGFVCTCYNFIFPSTASAFICQNKVNKTKYDPSTETCCNGTVASKLNHSDNSSSIECCEGTVLYQIHENNNERLITKKNINGQLKVYNLNVIFHNFQDFKIHVFKKANIFPQIQIELTTRGGVFAVIMSSTMTKVPVKTYKHLFCFFNFFQ